MTTIKIRKSMNFDGSGSKEWIVIIDTAKMQETINKDVVNYADFKAKSSWGPPTATKPRRLADDFLNIEREFMISGYINRECLDSPAIVYINGSPKPKTQLSVCYIRDVMNAMAMYGGVCYLQYGIPSDTTSAGGDIYFETDTYKYYTNTGFSCHIRRIQWTEVPEDKDTYLANYKVPVTYECAISLIHAYDMY